MIYKKFLGSDLSEEEQIQLKEIDRAMLWYDLKRLLKRTAIRRSTTASY